MRAALGSIPILCLVKQQSDEDTDFAADEPRLSHPNKSNAEVYNIKFYVPIKPFSKM